VHLSKRYSAVAAALLAAVALTAAAPELTPVAAAAGSQASPGGSGHTITLVTGDRVTVLPTGDVSVEAGPGRDGMAFETRTVSGHVRVIPADAGPLLASNTMDPRLFDVTQLIRDGYDKRDSLPLILTGSEAGVRGIPGLSGVRGLPAAGAVAARQERGKAADAWRALTDRPGHRLRSGVGKVWLDGVRRPTLDVSVPQIGAPGAWAAGYTGTGTTVAVLDTGIDDTHPDLVGQVAERVNFTEGEEADGDFAGHGTHVASTVAGTGAASGGLYKGVAPGAKLLDGKVCAGYCYESWILAGMAWAASRAKVINLSLGGADTSGLDPVEQAVQTLSEQYGTLFVVAAGNADGVTEGSISSPGTAPAALTVGAVDSTDAVAVFSRRGPGPDGSLKPEITAPGVAITAARSKDANVDFPGSAGDPYVELSGTSMATPHVAGSAALLAQQHPDWSGQRLKAALMAAAQPNTAYSVYAQGAGRLDAARAVRQAVTSTTAGVSFGFRAWPHTDDEVTAKTVTYHNDGAQPVTLALDLPGTPMGMFTTSAASVTVPAGGDATITVTADTRVGPDGRFGGWLTATAGDVVVRTPVVVDKEVESYDVTLTHLDRTGGTPSFFDTQLARRDSDTYQQSIWGPDPGGTVMLRLPKGHYTLTSFLFHWPDTPPPTKGVTAAASADEQYAVVLAQPDIDVTGPMSISLDARAAQPITVTVPPTDAEQYDAVVAAYTRRPHGTAGGALIGGSFDGIYTAQLRPAATDDGFVSILSGQWARADADGNLWNSPYTYALSFPERGRMATGFQRAVTDAQLARVRADFARAQPGTAGLKRIRSGLTSYGVGNFAPSIGFDLPFTRTEYYTADPDVTFSGDFSELSLSTQEPISSVFTDGGTAYRVDRAYHERWNRAVFAPGVGGGVWEGVTRSGDTLLVDAQMYADGDGRPGSSVMRSFAGTLYRDGVKDRDLDPESLGMGVDVPPGPATYRLELRAERDFALSTRTEVAWTFRSGHVDGGSVALPLWAIRLAPDVDRYDGVPANGVHSLAVSAVAQAGSQPGQLTGLTVETSVDDGLTWRAVSGTGGCAQVRTPAGSGFVSLRSTATDSAGNTVRQTVIRAYRFG